MTPRPSVAQVLAVSLGGAVGALGRWSAGRLVPDGPGFPWTTFAVNVAGCLLLAALTVLPAVRRRPALLALIGPGLLGGFTTLSAYADQTRGLVAAGEVATAAAYAGGTLVACLGAVAVASRVAASRS